MIARRRLTLVLVVATAAARGVGAQTDQDTLAVLVTGDLGQHIVGAASTTPAASFIGRVGEGYRNYAFEDYQNYATVVATQADVERRHILTRSYYGPLGNLLIRGRPLYNWDRSQTVDGQMRTGTGVIEGGLGALGSVLSMGRQSYSGWAGQLIVSGTGLDFWTEGIIVRFTPLTLNRVSLQGARADLVTPFGDALTMVLARMYSGGGTGGTGFNYDDNGLILGGHYERQAGPLVVGVTYVNQHTFDTRNPTNDMRGDLHSSQTVPALVAVRVSDDSPFDGRGGPVVFDMQPVVNGETRMDLLAGVVSRDLTDRFTLVGKTSAMTGMFLPSHYYDPGPGGSTLPYRGLFTPLYADFLYRRDYALDPTDPNVARNTDVGRLGEYLQWEDPRKVLQANGTQGLVYYIDLEGEPYVRSLEILLTVGNDCRVEVSSLGIANPNATSYDERYTAPYYETVYRAPGNVQDLSNVTQIRVPVDIVTGVSVRSANMAFEIPGLRVTGEFAESRRHTRYPDGRPGDMVTNVAGKPGLSEWYGRRRVRRDQAWYVQMERAAARYTAGAEVFSMGEGFNQRIMLKPGDYKISFGRSFPWEMTYNQTTFSALLEDNDDGDAAPEDIVPGGQGPPDFAVFPGVDTDGDGIPDTNRNANGLPDYTEPFLLYDVDPDEYVYGLDTNNNDVVDEREDDLKVDLPFDRDLRGAHAYVRLSLHEGLTATAGRLGSRQVAGGNRNDQWYGRLHYEWSHPRVGSLVLDDELKRVRDSVADDILNWVAGATELGKIWTADLTAMAGRFMYSSELVPDQLRYRNSLANRAHLEAVMRWLPGWVVKFRLKVEHNQQYASVFQDGTTQPRRRFRRLALVQQLDYTWTYGRLSVRPAMKALWLKEKAVPVGGVSRHARTIFPILSARCRFSDDTELKAGVQGLAALPVRHTDLVGSRNSYSQRTAIAVLSNMADYSGYQISTNLGVMSDRLEFRDPYRNLESYATTSLFVRVFLGYPTSVLF